MIKEITLLLEKYKRIQKSNYEYVPIEEVLTDLRRLLGEVRIRRLPKNER